jgi:hypothetical protein
MDSIRNYDSYFNAQYRLNKHQEILDYLNYFLDNQENRDSYVFSLFQKLNEDEFYFHFILFTPYKYKFTRIKNLFVDYDSKKFIIIPNFKDEVNVNKNPNYKMFFDYITKNFSNNPKIEFINKLTINNELKVFCKSMFNYEYKKEPLVDDRNNYFLSITKKCDHLELEIKNPLNFYHKDKIFINKCDRFFKNPEIRDVENFRFVNDLNTRNSKIYYVVEHYKNQYFQNQYEIDFKNKKLILFPNLGRIENFKNFFEDKENVINYCEFENYLYNNLTGKPSTTFINLVKTYPKLFLFCMEYIQKINYNKKINFDLTLWEINYIDTKEENEYEKFYIDPKNEEINEYLYNALTKFPTLSLLEYINSNPFIFDYITNLNIFNELLQKNENLRLKLDKKVIFRVPILNPEEECWAFL